MIEDLKALMAERTTLCTKIQSLKSKHTEKGKLLGNPQSLTSLIKTIEPRIEISRIEDKVVVIRQF